MKSTKVLVLGHGRFRVCRVISKSYSEDYGVPVGTLWAVKSYGIITRMKHDEEAIKKFDTAKKFSTLRISDPLIRAVFLGTPFPSMLYLGLYYQREKFAPFFHVRYNGYQTVPVPASSRFWKVIGEHAYNREKIWFPVIQPYAEGQEPAVATHWGISFFPGVASPYRFVGPLPKRIQLTAGLQPFLNEFKIVVDWRVNRK